MTPREFILHWHREARLAAPRLAMIPNSWERQAVLLMERGITAEDLSLVARWMLTQLARSQGGERNSVAFNAASFQWPKMFGRMGETERGDDFELIAAMLASAEAGKRPSATGIKGAFTVPAKPVNEAQDQAIRDSARLKAAEFRKQFGGPG